jgi:hypothetical protein
VITDQIDFDSYNQKSMGNLTIWADKPSSTASVTVYWSDDDYQNYNSGVSVDLYQERPNLNRLGRFRRRAFKLTYAANQPLRLKGLEVDVNMGST